MTDDKYHISFLGDFIVAHGGKSVSDRQNRTRKPWNLIEYILTNRNRAISQEELLDLVWSDKQSDNSPGALKVLLHRARKLLEPVAPDTDLIILKKGHYRWNNDIDIEVDADLFMELAKEVDAAVDPAQKTELLERATGLYKGDYLCSNNENWVIPYANEYRKEYIRLVIELSDSYSASSRYSDDAASCADAIRIDPYNEELYYRMINSLFLSGHQPEALEAYNTMTDTFYRQFAVTPSDRLKSLYRTIVSTTNALVTDIGIIRDSFEEKGTISGAFSCEYEFFKDICQLKARACAREGDSAYLALITISGRNGITLPDKVVNKAVDTLASSIRENLRKGDVYSRYSLTQYVILLPTSSFENVESAMQRIVLSFNKKLNKKDVLAGYRMQPLDPK